MEGGPPLDSRVDLSRGDPPVDSRELSRGAPLDSRELGRGPPPGLFDRKKCKK